MITSMRRCVACDDLWPWPISARSFDLDFENRIRSVTFSVLDRQFFLLGIQYDSIVWVIMRRRGESSERTVLVSSGIQGRQQERIYPPHGLMVEPVEISGQALWSGAGYLLHITTTAVQHNRDDMSVLCLIDNGHDIHLYPYHSTFCRWPISSMSRSAMLPWSVWSSSAQIYFLRHGFEHVGSRYKIFTVCCFLIIVLAEAVFAIEIPWNTKTVAASRVHRIASHFEQNVFPPMTSQGLTNGGACFFLSRPWPQFQNIVFVYWRIEHVPDSDLSSQINDN